MREAPDRSTSRCLHLSRAPHNRRLRLRPLRGGGNGGSYAHVQPRRLSDVATLSSQLSPSDQLTGPTSAHAPDGFPKLVGARSTGGGRRRKPFGSTRTTWSPAAWVGDHRDRPTLRSRQLVPVGNEASSPRAALQLLRVVAHNENVWKLGNEPGEGVATRTFEQHSGSIRRSHFACAGP